MGSITVDVGIGYTLSSISTLQAKLDVLSTNHSYGIYSFVNQSAGRFISAGDCSLDPGSIDFVGITGRCIIQPTLYLKNFNIGGDFYGNQNTLNIGARGNAIGATAYGGSSTLNVGIFGLSRNAYTNIAGYFNSGFTISYFPASQNVGVFGLVPHSLAGATVPNYAVYGSVGYSSTYAGITAPDWAGYFNGDLGYTGNLTHVSDSTLKNNIAALSNDSAINLIRDLQPKTFDFDTSTYGFMNLPLGGQVGLISQEVETVLPQLVKHTVFPEMDDSSGAVLNHSVNYLGLNYVGLIPICIGAIKEIDSTLNARPKDACNATWVDTIENKYQWGTNPLCHTTVVPMIGDSSKEWDVYFTGQSLMTSGNPADVGIGYSTDSLLKGKLDVMNESSIGASELTSYDYTNLYAGRFYNTGYGIGIPEHWGQITDILGEHFAAVYGKSNVREGEEDLALMNIGGDFTANNSTVNVGVRNIIGYEKTPGAISNIGTLSIIGSSQVAYGTYSMAVGAKTGSIGVYGSAYNGKDYNYGVWGQTDFEHDSTTAAGIANYAIYGELNDSGPTTPDFAGYFNGDLGTTAGFYQVSDSKFKKDIKPFSSESAMDILNQLQPKTYSFDNRKFKSMALPFGNQYGLLSDDVEKVLPGLVKNAVQAPKTDQFGKITIPSIEYKALNYTALIPILVAGVKEVDSTNDAQQQQNAALQNQVTTLQQQLDEMKLQLQQISDCCKQQNTGTVTPVGTNLNPQQVVELGNYAIILDQNSPNPFAEKTTITFTIPTDIKDAQLLFSDDRGTVIKTVQINTRGAGSLLVYASNLSSGIYSYSLLADGKLIDTKKMICQKP